MRLLPLLVLIVIAPVLANAQSDDRHEESDLRRAEQSSHRHLSQLRSARNSHDLHEHHPRPAVIRSDVTTSNVTAPLFAHSGVHHVNIYVGSPPQKQTLIVDTGSRLMSFSCKDCGMCGKHANPRFDPQLSSSVDIADCGACRLAGISSCGMYDQHCTIKQKYTEGSSWTAYEMEDMVWIGTDDVVASLEDYMQTAVPHSFGCQTITTGLFRNQYADGIFGLARHDTSLLKNMAKEGVIAKDAFSLCLTKESGQISLGGTHPNAQHKEPMRFVPLYREHGFFSIEVVAVDVGNERVLAKDDKASASKLDVFNQGKGTILDTGTTDTYLPMAVAAVIKAAMARAMAKTDIRARALFGKDKTQSFTYNDFRMVPTVTIHLVNGVRIVMEPANFLEHVPVDGSTGKVVPWRSTKRLTNRLYVDEKEGAVLGGNAMFGYEILYDTQGHQVGIAKADCSSYASTFKIDPSNAME